MNKIFIIVIVFFLLMSCNVKDESKSNIVENTLKVDESRVTSKIKIKSFKEKYEFPEYFGVYKYDTDFTLLQKDTDISSRVVLYKNSKGNLMEITLSKEITNDREGLIQSYQYLTIPLVVDDGLVLKGAAGGVVWFSKGDFKYIKYSKENTEGTIEGKNAESFKILAEWLLNKFPPNYTIEYLKISDISKYKQLKLN